MTYEELRDALKNIDRIVSRTNNLELRDAVSDLSEYLLKLHARVERLNVTVSSIGARIRNRGDDK